jgi:hypothetical protein
LPKFFTNHRALRCCDHDCKDVAVFGVRAEHNYRNEWRVHDNRTGANSGWKNCAHPLYRDPPFDAPTDPVLCFNAEQTKWFMYYTACRAAATNAPGVTWIYGSNIGMAESSDGGATWTHRGTADISYGKDKHPNDYTYWAPEVIWVAGTYHMFLTFVPGIFTNWNYPREIVHLTSTNGVKWDAPGPVDLKPAREEEK